MSSKNFIYLRDRWPVLFEHACFSEKYLYSDPQSAVVKLRCYAELMVGTLYKKLSLQTLPNSDFFQKLNLEEFSNAVGRNIIKKFHAIRMLGNKAAHGKNNISPEDVEKLYYDAYLLGKWFYLTLVDYHEDYPDYIAPKKIADYRNNINQVDLQKQLDQVLQELEEIKHAEENTAKHNLELQSQLDEQEKELQEYQQLQDQEYFKRAAKSAENSFNIDMKNTNALISLEDAFSSYDLTEGQSLLVKQLASFLESKDENVFLLNGYAGTGKTFISKGLTEYFQTAGRNFILAAPTGKAAKVIAKKTQVGAYTIHKTIYDMERIQEYADDGLDGSQTYKLYATIKENLDSVDTVYIIDEASMVANIYHEDEFLRFGSGFLLNDLMSYINLDHNDHHKKIIFIGDNAQLPPIGMNFSPALNKEYLTKKFNITCSSFELTEVVRQKKNSGVIKNAMTLRDALHKDLFNKLEIDNHYSDINEVSYSDIINQYMQSCQYKINGESIIVAHSNADVAAFNQEVRNQFFPGQNQIVPGDKVMAVMNDTNHGLFISNGDFGLIRRVSSNIETKVITLKSRNKTTGQVEKKEISITFRDVEVGFNDLQGKAHFFHTKIIENLLYSSQPNLTSDENKALYIDFCIRNSNFKANSQLFKDALKVDPYFNAMRLKFGYAITCHKAQGSEWNHVFIKCKTHQNQLTRDYFRWLYTAITRTSNNLYLLESPKIGIGSNIRIIGDPNMSGIASNNTNTDNIKIEDESNSSVSAMLNIADQLELPENAFFSRILLTHVLKLIENQNIVIQSISVGQYQDGYYFKQGENVARINIYYNSKGLISRLMEVKSTEFSESIIMLLAPLKGMLVVVDSSNQFEVQFDFLEDYQIEFHEKLIDITKQYNTKIIQVEPRNWALRYTFSLHNQNVEFDIFYNGKKQFTKCMPVGTVNSDLLGTISHIITKGLQ